MILFSCCVNQQQNGTTTTIEEIQETTAVKISTTTTGITTKTVISENCSDSDGGRSYDIRGEVSLPDGTRYADYCYSDKVLIEYACDLLEGTAVNCPTWASNGACVDGACTRAE